MDAFNGFATLPISINKYTYGNSEPINTIDPSENFGLNDIRTAINIASKLAVRSITNIGRSTLNSFNRSLSKIGSRIKNGIKPKTKIKKKGKNKDEEGSTFQEFMVMLEAKTGAGYLIQPKYGKGSLGDEPRLVALYGDGTWVKMEWKRKISGGKIIIVHWFRNLENNDNVEFKFKRRK